jgi:tetratricopeptide (TPR) repeat protein
MKVLISATGKELGEHRLAALEAIAEAGFTALVTDLEISKETLGDMYRQADQAELYIGLIGNRYGYVPRTENPDDYSVGELVYRRVLARNLPAIICLFAEEERIGTDTLSGVTLKYRQRLKQWRAEMSSTSATLIRFLTPAELGEDLRDALERIKAGNAPPTEPVIAPTSNTSSLIEPPKSGWMNAPKIAPPKTVPPPPISRPVVPDVTILIGNGGNSAHRFSQAPLRPLFYFPHMPSVGQFAGRDDLIDEMNAWAYADDSALVLDGPGGIGKSALAYHWLTTHAQTYIGGLAGAIWWRLDESDGNLTNFVRRALAYITGQTLEAVDKISPAEREKILLSALQDRPYVVVLDGVERLLGAYFRIDAPYLSENQVEKFAASAANAPIRRTTDAAQGALLVALAKAKPSKVIFTTRIAPTNLMRSAGLFLPGIRRFTLKPLEPRDAIKVLQSWQISGNDYVLGKVATCAGREPLLLNILAGVVARSSSKGDGEVWLKLNEARFEALEPAQRMTQVMQMAIGALTSDEVALLSTLAVFRYPINFAAMYAVNPFVPIPPAKMTEPRRWRNDYAQLKPLWETYQQQMRDHENATIEALPRVYVALKRLEVRGLIRWEQAGARLDIHSVVKGYIFGVLNAERRNDLLNRSRAYYERLSSATPRDYSELRPQIEIYIQMLVSSQYDAAANYYRTNLSKLGLSEIASAPEIAELLHPLFPNGSKQPPALSSAKDRGFFTNELALMLGYMGKTGEALTLLELTFGLFVDENDTPSLCAALIHYAGLLRDDHQIAAKIQVFILARDLAEAAGDMETLAVAYLFLLKSYVDNGQWEEAERAYRAFQAVPQNFRPASRQATAERVYAKMLVCKGQDPAMTLNLAWEYAIECGAVAEQRAIHALWGETSLQQGRPDAAQKFFQAALDLSTGSAVSISNYLGGLARAMVQQGRLKEARETVERGAALAAAADVYTALGERDKAENAAFEAYRLAWADGPPYSFWWELEQAKRALAALGMPEPDLPPFDQSSLRPLPHEKPIRAHIEGVKARVASLREAQ